MNLVDRYIDVIKKAKGYTYDVEVLDYLNQVLGTDYLKQTLYNWRALNNPRPVPRDVKAHMRETVVVYTLNELESGLKAPSQKKLAQLLNDEQKMRQQLLNLTLDDNGVSVSARRRKAIAESLETLYDKQG